MTFPSEGMLLRIYVGESDRHSGKPLYEWLTEQAREQGLAGATVLRGMMGFGAHSRMHTFKIERLSEDLPMIIECVDSADRLEAFLRHVEPAITEGLATIEPVGIRHYRSRPSSSPTKDHP
jgi:PII-like signaling protein